MSPSWNLSKCEYSFPNRTQVSKEITLHVGHRERISIQIFTRIKTPIALCRNIEIKVRIQHLECVPNISNVKILSTNISLIITL